MESHSRIAYTGACDLSWGISLTQAQYNFWRFVGQTALTLPWILFVWILVELDDTGGFAECIDGLRFLC